MVKLGSVLPCDNEEAGVAATAAEGLGKLAYLAGFNPSAEPKTAEQLLADFDWAKVPKEDIRLPEGLF